MKQSLCQLSYIVKALETIGIEPIAFCLQSKHSSQLSYAPSVVKVLLLEQLKNMVCVQKIEFINSQKFYVFFLISAFNTLRLKVDQLKYFHVSDNIL